MTQTNETAAAEGGNGTNRTAEDIKNEARAKAHEVKEEIRTKAHEVKEGTRAKAHEMKERMAERADSTTSRVGRKIESVSQSVREHAPEDGRMHDAAFAMADRLDRVGSYLQESDVGTLTEDLTSMVRRHPVRSVFVGMGLGYLVGRLMTRKR